MEHAFANKWDGGALIIKQGSLNWVKFCFEKDYTGARRVVSVVTKNISGFRVGFLAQSPSGERCEVRFSKITYQVKTIKDPYLGE